jgi:hypothetical protein
MASIAFLEREARKTPAERLTDAIQRVVAHEVVHLTGGR